MKKLCIVALVISLMFMFVACKTTENAEPAPQVSQPTAVEEPAAEETPAEPAAPVETTDDLLREIRDLLKAKKDEE